jgi:hypothetical protein
MNGAIFAPVIGAAVLPCIDSLAHARSIAGLAVEAGDK